MEERLEEMLHKESLSITLDEEEKNQLRESLLHHMEQNPIRPQKPLIVLPKFRKLRIPFGDLWGKCARLFSDARTTKIVIIIALVLLLGGISFMAVASRAMPGDRLYSIRVLADKFRGAFAVTTKAKIGQEIDIITRDLVAYEKLKAESVLTPERETVLRAEFIEHLKAYSARLEQYKLQKDQATAMKVRQEFYNIQRAHMDAFRTLTSTK